jgi:hypothetical protein
MTFQLAAVVAEEFVLAQFPGFARLAPRFPLDGRYAILPMTRALSHAAKSEGRAILDGFRHLSEGMVARLVAASAIGAIAYVEAEFIGGTGEQSAVAWRNGALALGPLRCSHYDRTPVPPIGDWPINRILREIGVSATGRSDEFDTLRLGRYPRMEEWLEHNPGRSSSGGRTSAWT